MKKVFIIIKVFCTLFIHAQNNLVINPSFETYTTCPNSGSQMYLAINWWAVMNTPDYLNSCATLTTQISVPYNFFGHQHPASGQAYGGFFNWLPKTGTEYREYLRSQLTQSLIVGIKYYLSVKFSISENWGEDITGNSFPKYLPSNKMGLKFTTKPVFVGTNTVSANLTNNFAHLYSQAIISDTTHWTTIQGSFIADSNYSYLMIGNFFENAQTNILVREGTGYSSYYYVDDVIVSTDSTIIDYTLGMAESSYTNKLMLYPNPAKDNLNLVFDNKQNDKNNKAFFYNLLGELIYQKPITETNTEIDISFLKRGLYYVKVQNAVAKVLVE